MLDIGLTGLPANTVKDTLSRPFRPGQFFQTMGNAGIKFGIPRDDVLNKIMAASEQSFAGALFLEIYSATKRKAWSFFYFHSYFLPSLRTV